MEIEVGEYIRTKDGNIQKVLKIQPYYENDKNRSEYDYMNTETFKQWKRYQFEEIVVKHSKNIIDLIEVGDYVNGSLVISDTKNTRTETCDGEEHKCIIVSRSKDDVLGWKMIDFDIKDILTKEQYKQNSFKL